MNRRDFLLAGAAVLGNSAISSPVKSLLGGDAIGNMDDAKTAITAKSYVQDGLLVLQDGIENVGWGVHDPNPDIWVNLVNPNVLGYDLRKDKSSSSSPLYFKEDAICRDVCAALNISCRYKPFTTFPIQVEFVAYITASWNEAKFITWENANGLVSFANYAIKVTGNLTTAPSFKVPSQQQFSASFYCARHNSTSFDDYLAYVNNEQVSLTSRYSYVGTGYQIFDKCAGEINCLRIYNRLLSESEIAHNYEVDKVRFNLP